MCDFRKVLEKNQYDIFEPMAPRNIFEFEKIGTNNTLN